MESESEYESKSKSKSESSCQSCPGKQLAATAAAEQRIAFLAFESEQGAGRGLESGYGVQHSDAYTSFKAKESHINFHAHN